ncbi:sensor histidine kinase [Agrobacterium sp. ES01]|uniref:sensor histidine kinase n=1 Tax=Agrobacterium sp. ES01 TaxID=3420714 RepID=UPI003D12A33E
MAISQGRRSSLAMRLTLVLTLVFAVAAVAAVIATYRYGRAAADVAFDRLLTGAALQISERVFATDGKLQVDLPLSAFELLSFAADDRVFYRIVSADGVTITGYDDLPLPDAVRGQAQQPLVYNIEYAGAPVRAVMLQRRLAEKQLRGPVSIIVAQTTEARAALATDIATRAMAGTALAGLAIIAIAFIAMRFAMRPLGRIETAMLARDPLDLSPITEEVPQEVDALVSAINRFMARLDRRVRDMQEFVADTAHQMRTPITALRAQTEIAIDETDAARLKLVLHRIRSRAIGVSRLMEQLLSEALVIHRSDAQPLVATDLRRVALEAEREYRTTVRLSGDLLELDLCADEAMVAADSFSLREAIKNLIANSFVHGKPPVCVRVTAENDGTCLVQVEDKGNGLDPEKLQGLGKRFSRRDDQPGSAGLGLSIARKVALFHKGELVSGQSDRGVFWIGIRLPMLPEVQSS